MNKKLFSTLIPLIKPKMFTFFPEVTKSSDIISMSKNSFIPSCEHVAQALKFYWKALLSALLADNYYRTQRHQF